MTSHRLGRVIWLATALHRDDIVVGADENAHRVHVLGLRPAVRISTFDTIIDSGGTRLALCTPDGAPIVVAGAWERHGVCAYDGLTGERLWQRKDLKRVQRLSPIADERLVSVGLEGRSMHLLDLITGATRFKLRAAESLWQSRLAPLAAAGYYNEISLYDSTTWGRLWKRGVPGHSVGPADFSPDSILVSSRGLTCFDLRGEIRWQVLPAAMVGYREVAWDGTSNEWVTIEGHANRLVPDSIVRWSDQGSLRSRMQFLDGLAGAVFLPGGRALVTNSGALIDATTGQRSVAFENLALN